MNTVTDLLHSITNEDKLKSTTSTLTADASHLKPDDYTVKKVARV
jgi:hypothetical protein